MGSTHTVSVLFSKQRDRMSCGLYWVTGRKYTHVSLRLDEMGEEFYSFNVKGFCREKPRYFNAARTERSVLYQLHVSDAVYAALQSRLQAFIAQPARYRYNSLGVLLCLLHIPHCFPRAYFCSQFVAEALQSAGALPLRHRPSVCLPNTLERELQASGVARAVVCDPFRALTAA